MRILALSAQAQLDPLPSPGGGFRAIAGLVIVLGVLFTLAWMARRGKLRLPGSRGRAAVAIEAAVPLGERRSLVVVSVEGRRLLLGLTPAQVSRGVMLAHEVSRELAAEMKRLCKKT